MVSRKVWVLIYTLILWAALSGCAVRSDLPTLAVLPTVRPSLPALSEGQTDTPATSESLSPLSETLVSPTALPLTSALPSTSMLASEQRPIQQASPTAALSSAPAQATVPHQMVITFKPGTTSQERSAYILSIGGTMTQTIEALNTVVITVPETSNTPPPASNLVAVTEPDHYVSAQSSNDPLYPQQWALPVIGAPQAWDALPPATPSVTVAVVDSGVCAAHPDLQGRILEGWDYIEADNQPQDEFGHGCGVAGIIAANTNNNLGIAGVAPNAMIMPLRVLDGTGVGTYSNVAAAIVYAVDHGAAIINVSLGGTVSSNVLQQAIDYAAAHNVTIVAAAGNLSTIVLYPAAYDSVISVGSVDQNLQYSGFSPTRFVDVFAPGRDVLSLMPDGTYATMTGTSFAAPHVTATLAVGHFDLATMSTWVVSAPVTGSLTPSATNSVITDTSGLNPIQLENLNPGTPLNDPKLAASVGVPSVRATAFVQPVINGYASEVSIQKGESISFYISTSRPSYTINIYRVGWYGGAGTSLKQTIPGLTGVFQATPDPDPVTGLLDANWQVSYVLQTSTSWTTGVYLASLVADNGETGYIIFVIRDDLTAADILFQIPVTTYQAYNNWGGKSLYTYNSTNGQAARKVSFNRPYDGSRGAGQFFEGNYGMIRFLESQGYNISYATNNDIETNANILSNKKMFLTDRHDEYWSMQMRNNLKAARDAGKSIAFFAANNIYWQIRFEPSASGQPNRTIVCYKSAALDPYSITNPSLTTVRFRQEPVNFPENELLGSMYESDYNYNLAYPWVVQNANHWVYAGTGLAEGDSIPGVVGYEYDKLHDNGFTPSGTISLSNSPVLAGEYAPSVSNGTIYQAPSGAYVFNAGTIDWSWKVDDNSYVSKGADARIQQMTRNVLNTMIGPLTPVPTETPTPTNTFTPSATWIPNVTSYRDLVLYDGAVAYWRLGESSGTTATDEKTGYPGLYTNPTLGQTGALFGDTNTSALFDGTSSFVSVPYNAALNPSTFTIEAWVYLTGGTGFRGVASSRQYPKGWVLYAGNNNRWTFWFNSASTMVQLNGPTVQTNVWTHLVATFDGTTGRLYVNGVLAGSAASASYTPTTVRPFTIGQGELSSQLFFPGRIDEVAFYSSVLSQGQIMAHYGAGLNGYGSSITETPTPTPTETLTPTITETPTETLTPTIAETPTETPSETPTLSQTPTPTATPTVASGPVYRDLVLYDGAVAYWRLGESSGTTATDEKTGYPGLYTNPTLGQTGALFGDTNTSALFDGTSSFVSVPYNAALNPSTFTIEAWVYLTGGTGFRGVASSRQYPKGWVLYAGNNNRWTFWFNSASTMVQLNGPTVQTNVWTHLVATFDGTTGRLYVNGVLAGSATSAGYAPVTSRAFTVGQGEPGAKLFFPGRIDEVAFYSSVLSQGQITAHYNTGLNGGGSPAASTPTSTPTITATPTVTPTYTPTITPTHTPTTSPTPGTGGTPYRDVIVQDGVLAYWRLGENSGVTATDEKAAYPGLYTNPTLGQTGALFGDANTSVLFSGASSFVNVPYNAALNPSTFTIEAWVYLTGGSGYRGIASSRQYPKGWVLYAGSNNRWTFWFNSVSTMVQANGPTVQTNVWTHLVATFDGTTGRLYVNGVLSGSAASAQYASNALNAFTIGQGEPAGTRFFFPGRIDEVAFYSTVLSATQINTHYTLGQSGVGPFSMTANELATPVPLPSATEMPPTPTPTEMIVLPTVLPPTLTETPTETPSATPSLTALPTEVSPIATEEPTPEEPPLMVVTIEAGE